MEKGLVLPRMGLAVCMYCGVVMKARVLNRPITSLAHDWRRVDCAGAICRDMKAQYLHQNWGGYFP